MQAAEELQSRIDIHREHLVNVLPVHAHPESLRADGFPQARHSVRPLKRESMYLNCIL